MADQATVNGNGNSKSVVGNIADFGNDVATLVELQAKLAATDLKEVKDRATGYVIVLIFAVIVALGTIPIALFGVADLLAMALQVRLGWALLITAGIALSVTGAVLALVLPRLSSAVEPLRRSREELIRNVSWVRTVLLHSGRAIPKRH